MAQPQSSPNSQAISAAVVVAGHEPYAMYVATELSAISARLRGPLLLEIGETFTVRMTRAAVVVEVATRVVEVKRAAHGESEMLIAFTAGEAAALAPLLG
ncbi:MAG: hypothetical protein IPL61_30750 [Myxococcales bacterium]|nr:hypothetical protein [Myxococcales bacterium]